MIVALPGRFSLPFLVDLESSMLYSKITPSSFLCIREEDFLSVLPYMGIAVILFNDTEPFEQSVNIP